MTTETFQCILRRLRNPVDSIYRLVWGLERDPVKDPPLGERSHLRNLVLSMPDRVFRFYRDEIDFLESMPPEYLLDHMMPYRRLRDGPVLDVGFDAGCKLPYVVHEGRKLFFPATMSLKNVEKQYRSFTEEEGLLGMGCLQKSPHRYVSENFQVQEEDVLLDVGCAEGIFAFHYAPVVNHIYLFEGLKTWKKPLKCSFKSFSGKTTFINRFLGKETNRKTIKLEDALSGETASSYFLKMDIEGAERIVIESFRSFLLSHKVKVSCCVYHHQDDAEVITAFLRELGYQTAFSEGYMLPNINGVHFPYFRHGVVFARNDGGLLP